ncbi:putative glycosyl transferase [Tolypothrix sp. NIES-4075]|uniref:glycosyltransferase family 2 protein n=1 Tax=Tolypothrix sp. NIES-4075 TaxID=2005459 RepID=UPI000B5C4BC3|nr:glycosyltransferase family 2 protein [Tolypothrix sp. NIES-4075]GAX44186.1 putative glycosyl transferase [Tolypothrix sp. NIES-4075]
MQPIVSICIPTYNGAKYLRECLDSVLTQTFTDFEVLLIDDQSSDETLSIAQEYAAKDSRICVKQNERNLGLVGNWNRCIELAQGQWIKFVFQDDLIAPECLEKMLAASKPDSSIICCLRNFIFEAGTPEKTRHFFKNRASLEKLFPESTEISASDYCQAVLKQIDDNFVGEPTVVMLRRDVFYRFGTFNPHLIQLCDLEFWTRVAIHTGMVYVRETLATFRVHNNATTAKNHSGRQYRTSTLDPLILLHDCALHPTYAPLRIVATNQPKSFDLVARLRKQCYWAWRDSKKDSNSLAEWEKMTLLYPAIYKFAKRGLIQLVISELRRHLGHLKPKIKRLFPSTNKKSILTTSILFMLVKYFIVN